MLRGKKITLIPVLGILSIILIGTILLKLPICNTKPISYEDALFTATSSVCVTGFATVTLSEQFTFIGQLVILLLAQVGAIGFMVFFAFIMSINRKRIKFSDTVLIGSLINSNEYGKIKDICKEIIMYTFIIEGIGAFLLAFRFVPVLGTIDGIWGAIFHSVMAFCNAGFDILGDTSMAMFRYDNIVNIVMIVLMLSGGIGFFVIEDIIACIKKKNMKKLNFQSKIVLSATAFLVISSTIFIMLVEKDISFLNALFSVSTTRTAGFFVVDFNEFSTITKLLTIMLMFIGGAPASTSGGIRIVAFSILVLTTMAAVRDRRNVIVFSKRIDNEVIKKSIGLVVLSISIILIASMLLIQFDNFGTLNIIFHTVSAFSTTGLGLFNSANLSLFGKMVIVALMYIGRVGPITFIVSWLPEKKVNNNIDYIDASVIL